MAERLNIPFITSDQQRGDCYGFEGRRVKTPHLDDLGQARLGADQAIPATRKPPPPALTWAPVTSEALSDSSHTMSSAISSG